MLQSTQITGGQPYVMMYTYNLAGDILTEQYPSGRVVTSAYDGAGRLNSLTGAISATAAFKNYATQFTYTAPGGIANVNLGNGLWENNTFNSRLQPMQMGLGTSSTDTSLFDLNYGFGTSNNNGNVLSETISAGQSTTFNQAFTYDQVNRLQTATEMNGSATNWSRTYSYDVFGNMWVSATGGTASMPLSPLTPTAQSAYSIANNNQLVASSYDAAGNQTADNDQTEDGNSYFYDGENMMTRCTVNGVSSSYQYDGSGRRITKTVNGLTTTFVYNSGGELIAEYGGPTPANTGTSYLTTDHLGSTRVVTNNLQAVVSRHDYEPFGGEITLLAGGRTGTMPGGLNYEGPDDTRQKFTSKERDTESNLDFFEARYLSAFQGRFSSPDEFIGGPEDLLDPDETRVNPTFYGELTQPQSLNKDQYCYENPLRFVDPDGHQEEQAVEKFLEWASENGDKVLEVAQNAAIEAGAVLTAAKAASEGFLSRLWNGAQKGSYSYYHNVGGHRPNDAGVDADGNVQQAKQRVMPTHRMSRRAQRISRRAQRVSPKVREIKAICQNRQGGRALFPNISAIRSASGAKQRMRKNSMTKAEIVRTAGNLLNPAEELGTT